MEILNTSYESSDYLASVIVQTDVHTTKQFYWVMLLLKFPASPALKFSSSSTFSTSQLKFFISVMSRLYQPFLLNRLSILEQETRFPKKGITYNWIL